MTSCFVPRGGFLYTMIVPRGGFLLPSSRVPGGGWFWMKLIPAYFHKFFKATFIREECLIPNSYFMGAFNYQRGVFIIKGHSLENRHLQDHSL